MFGTILNVLGILGGAIVGLNRGKPLSRSNESFFQVMLGVFTEGRFADVANNHGFNRSRWKRLWRQQIQDWLIAGIQNIRTLLKATNGTASGAMALLAGAFASKTRFWPVAVCVSILLSYMSRLRRSQPLVTF